LARTNLQPSRGSEAVEPADSTATGLVAAVVVFDREDLSMASIGAADEEAIVDHLRGAVGRDVQGKFDSADCSAEKIQCFFFGGDASRLEAVLLVALRSELLVTQES
jgi:hypothetical protein